jgi:hypothetical protein
MQPTRSQETGPGTSPYAATGGRSGAMMIFLLACTAPPEGTPDDTGHAGPTAIVLTVAGDYTSAAVAEIDVATYALRDTLAPTSTDPAIHTVALGGATVALLERFGADAVRLYDAESVVDWSAPIAEFSTGELSNPVSVAACGDALAVARYGRAELALYAKDGASLGEIDLSPWADADGLPEAADLISIEDRLYVALQRLDRSSAPWQAAGDGLVVAIDCATRAVVDAVPVGPNPSIATWPADPSRLLVRTGVYYDRDNRTVLDGAVGVLNPEDHTVTTWWTEAEAGFNLTKAVGTAEGMLVLSQDDAARYAVHCLTPNDRIDAEKTQAFLFSADAAPDGTVWVSARPSWEFEDAPVGISVWDPATCTAVGAPIHTLLPPYGMAFIGG